MKSINTLSIITKVLRLLVTRLYHIANKEQEAIDANAVQIATIEGENLRRARTVHKAQVMAGKVASIFE